MLRSSRKPVSAAGGCLALLATLFCLTLGFAAPAAAKKCVNPAGSGSCFALIQDALLAAAPGETVVIAPGVYREKFSVASPVVIVGGGTKPGAVVIDGMHFTDADTVTISASNVTLRNLTLRNSDVHLLVIGAGADNVTIDNVTFLRSDRDSCLATQGTGTSVVNSRFSQCDNSSVYVDAADDFLMRDSSVSITGSACVNVTGANARILGNRLRGCGGYGISVNGDSPRISGNAIEHTDGESIDVNSGATGAIIDANRILGSGSYGIYVNAGHILARNNVIQDTVDSGLYLYCGACTGGEISGNTAAFALGDGYTIGSTGSGTLLVQNNSAQSVQYSGFAFQVTAVTAKANRVEKAGAECFLFPEWPGALPSLARGNSAVSCGTDGFLVARDSLTLTNNSASVALASAFHVAAAAAGTTLTGNTANKSASKFCDQGTGTTLSGNNFSTSTCP